MTILVTSGVGRVPPGIAAFDVAVVRAGVAERRAVEQVERIDRALGGWGDRLYRGTEPAGRRARAAVFT